MTATKNIHSLCTASFVKICASEILLVEEVTRSLKHESCIVNMIKLWPTKKNQNLLKYA